MKMELLLMRERSRRVEYMARGIELFWDCVESDIESIGYRERCLEE